MPFETNVFVNCPFDSEYKSLLRPLLFVILYLKFEPQISQTASSADIRINKIKELIASSKYSIHDLSRSRVKKEGELPRFNMPYELGIDQGCIAFGNRKQREKKILILEKERYHIQKVLSDISGQDIENHDNKPESMITKIRNWFTTIMPEKNFPSGGEIWSAYNQFIENLNTILTDLSYSKKDIQEMPVIEYISFSKDWIRRN